MKKITFVRLISVFLSLALLLSGSAFSLAETGDGTQAVDAAALFEEGKDYWFGINGKVYDRDLAIGRFREAADAGCADAWYYLGNVALTGTEENRYETALESYRKAAEMGSLLALYGEGQIYESGRGVGVDTAKAKALYEEAIAGGCMEVNAGLAEMYLFGHGVEQDGQKAVAFAEKALEGEDFQLRCRAMIYIAKAYENGIGVEKDEAKCLEWNRKCADAGYHAGYGNLGNNYRSGIGVEEDLEEAIRCYEKAAEKGACDSLAWCYYNGSGVERNYEKAMELYLRNLNSSVISLGNGSNASFWYIATMYRDGLGVDQDYAAALEWYEKGVRDGDPSCMTDAADLYRSGKGTDKNPDRALELYEMAAKNDSSYACGQLGYLYQTGDGVEQSFEKAIAWYEKGAAAGNGYCCGQLGWIYLYGKGVDPNYEKARSWFEKGAEQDREYCYEKLGEIYNEGKGVEKDPEKAAEFYRIALDKAAENQNDIVAGRSVKALKQLGKTVKKIEINEKDAAVLVGAAPALAETQLTCTVTPEETFWKDVTWSSSDETVAAVNENGLVRGIAPGKAVISAAAMQPDAEAKAAQIRVVVNQAVTGIELETDAEELQIKKKAAIRAAVLPENAANRKLEWSSSDENVAAVSAQGQVTGIAEGEAVITAEAADGSGVRASLKITVYVPVGRIQLSEGQSFALPAGLSRTVTAEVSPENATDRRLVWSSSDETIASVDENGTVKGNSFGKAVITAAAADGSGVTGKTTVVVSQGVESVALDPDTLSIPIGKKAAVKAAVLPENAGNRKLEWISENEEIATVDAGGRITAVGVGTTRITAKSADGTEKEASAEVTVFRPVAKIETTEKKITLAPAENMKIEYTVSPEDATNQEIAWSSGNEEIATVDAAGNITGVVAGKCIVTGIAEDGSGVKVSVTVIVNP